MNYCSFSWTAYLYCCSEYNSINDLILFSLRSRQQHCIIWCKPLELRQKMHQVSKTHLGMSRQVHPTQTRERTTKCPTLPTNRVNKIWTFHFLFFIHVKIQSLKKEPLRFDCFYFRILSYLLFYLLFWSLSCCPFVFMNKIHFRELSS